jgi:DnaJ-class molecular chaperone
MKERSNVVPFRMPCWACAGEGYIITSSTLTARERVEETAQCEECNGTGFRVCLARDDAEVSR